jgi:hypothetical protein
VTLHSSSRGAEPPAPDPTGLDPLALEIEQFQRLVRSGEVDGALRLYEERLDSPLLQLDRYQEIVDCLGLALADAKASGPHVSSAEGDGSRRERSLLSSLALAHGYLGSPSRGAQFLARAAELSSPESNEYWSLVGSRSYFLLCTGHLAEADALFSSALDRSGLEPGELSYVHLRRGLLLTLRGEFDAARIELNAVQPSHSDRPKDSLTCHLFCYRALRAELMGEPQLARVCALRACRFAADTRQEARSKLLLARASALLADGATEAGRHAIAESERLLAEALAACRRTQVLELEIDVLLATSLVAQRTGRVDDSLRAATEALSLADRCEYRLKQCDAHLQLARLRRLLGDPSTSLRHAAIAMERAACDGSPHSYTVAMNEAGSLGASVPRSGPPLTGTRHVRYFVSSTFLDMREERDHLVKVTFPRIRSLCESRGVTWDEVDLRWGIPDEEQAEGNVLGLCLEEVDRCHPFFLGLLGGRYGSRVPVPGELIKRMPWLAAHADCSATELEILHGVLNDSAAATCALFYFRDPAYLARLRESSPPGRIAVEDETSVARMRSLEERIRQCGVLVREGYRDPEELGAWIEADLAALLDRLFPADEKHDAVAAAHEQFAASRLRLWMGRDQELRALDRMVANHRATLVIGRTGAGVSSLLANWAAAWRAANPRAFVVEHYVGAHPGATDLNGCCRQLCLALAAGRGLVEPVAAADRDWPDLFDEVLASAGAAGPVLLVIDGADGLRGRGASAGAEWLPSELPEGVTLVASAHEPAEELAVERGWPALQLRELAPDVRADFVRRYLALSGKHLSPERVLRIAAAPATGSAFHLTLLLEELRQHGDHATLGDRLEELLTAGDVPAFCDLIFARCERDYEGAVAGLTGDALCLLATAWNGLTEGELCELVGGPQGRLPQRHWAQLRLALQRVIVTRGGLLGFGQQEALQAARRRYVATPARAREIHRRLADYFLARPDSPRAAMELPHQLQELEAWDELESWLSRPGAFTAAWEVSPEGVCQTWAAVEAHSSSRAALASAAFPAALRPAVLRLLRNLGHWADALALAEEAAKEAQLIDDARWKVETQLTVGEIELEAGSAYDADTAFAQAEAHAAECGDERGQVRALQGQAAALRLTLERQRNAIDRTEWGRRLRAVKERLRRAVESSADPTLSSEELVLQLEDLISRGITLVLSELVGDLLRTMLQPTPAAASRQGRGFGNLGKQIQRAHEARRAGLDRLETAAQSLRHTRHRGLALRAEVALAKTLDDSPRLRKALADLRQYASAREDHEMLAKVWGDAADMDSGESRLGWLRKQEELLARTSRPAELLRNRWRQAETLWPGLGRRAEASELLARVPLDRRALPMRRERWRFLGYRLRLRLGLEEETNRLLLRVGIWLLGPLWLWGVLRYAIWVASWFSSLPVLGLLAYLLALPAAIAPIGMLLSELSDGLRALRRVLRRYARSTPRATNEPLAAASLASVAVAAEPPQASSPAAATAIADLMSEDPALAFGGKAIRWLTRMNRSLVRTRRIGDFLKLDRPAIRVLWTALVLPTGIAVTVLYWRLGFWGRMAALPAGLFGQILILSALSSLLAPLRQRALRRDPRHRKKTGNLLCYACALSFLRLKRRLLGRRRSRREARVA